MSGDGDSEAANRPAPMGDGLGEQVERVRAVLHQVDYGCGHFITGDNLLINDVADLLAANEATRPTSVEQERDR